MIGIINYGRGNIASVFNAVSALTPEVHIIDRPSELGRFSHVILPGVGAFGEAMADLHRIGWVDALNAYIRDLNRRFLGICLGMQLLAETGTEHGHYEGLGWISGSVTRLSETENARIPHIGWNDLELARDSVLFAGVEDGRDCYFVHSYALRTQDENCVTAWCTHSERFAVAVEKNNIFGTQFHPEKSHKVGMRVLKNFIEC